MNVSEHRVSGATLDERAHLATAMSHEARTNRANPVLQDRMSAEQTDSMSELRKQVGARQLQQSHLASVRERLQSPSQPPEPESESGSSGIVAPTPPSSPVRKGGVQMRQVLGASPMPALSLGRVPPVRPQGPGEPVLSSSGSPVGESSQDAGTGARGSTFSILVEFHDFS